MHSSQQTTRQRQETLALADLRQTPAMLWGALHAFNAPDVVNCVVPCVCVTSLKSSVESMQHRALILKGMGIPGLKPESERHFF